MNPILQLCIGLALIVAAFGIRDFGQSWLLRSKTDHMAFIESLDAEDDDADQPPKPTVH